MITLLDVMGRTEWQHCHVCDATIKRRERRMYMRGSSPDSLTRGTYWEALPHRVLPCGRYCEVGAPTEATWDELHYQHCHTCQRLHFFDELFFREATL